MKDANSWYICTGITPDEDMIHFNNLNFRCSENKVGDYPRTVSIQLFLVSVIETTKCWTSCSTVKRHK